jgi:hypothetical protein
MANFRPIRTTLAEANSLRLGPLVTVLILASLLVSCSEAEKPKGETAPSLVAVTEAVQPAAEMPSPEIDEVKEAVRRVFNDSFQIDLSRKPHFLVGDFNGDRTQDLAVVIKPNPERLADLNEEFPNWILKNPFVGEEPRIPRLRISATDSLLAVIHGYGPNGWRDPQATQTFVLKNAVGSAMTVHQPKSVAKTAKKTPYLRGDVIGQVVDGAPGFLYFAGLTYSWYDPKTFHEESDAGMAHLRTKRTETK